MLKNVTQCETTGDVMTRGGGAKKKLFVGTGGKAGLKRQALEKKKKCVMKRGEHSAKNVTTEGVGKPEEAKKRS